MTEDDIVSREVLDGQEILFPSAGDRARLLAEQVPLDGMTVVTADNAHWFSQRLEIVEDHEDLHLGLFRFRRGQCWMPVVVARRGERAQRVHLHDLTCRSCGWTGLVGNPCYWELYLEAPEKDEALDRAFGNPRFRCPDCEHEFETRVFWEASSEVRITEPGVSLRRCRARIWRRSGRRHALRHSAGKLR